MANSRDISSRPFSIISTLLANLEILFCAAPFYYGWVPAQPDTGCRGLLSQLNAEADSLAVSARVHKTTSAWVVPVCWHNLPGIYFFEDSKVLFANLKVALYRRFSWRYSPPNGGVHKLPFPFWDAWTIPPSLANLWVHTTHLHPRQSARLLLTARFQSWDSLFVGTEGEGTCAACASSYIYGELHLWRDCSCVLLSGFLFLISFFQSHASFFRPGVTLSLC